MRSSDSFRRDVEDWCKNSSLNSSANDFDKLRTAFYYAVPAIPESTKAAFFASFLSHYQEDSQTALTWFSGIVSILLEDYDDTKFTDKDWSEIRELVTLDSDDINIDTLTYILNLVLEHVGI